MRCTAIVAALLVAAPAAAQQLKCGPYQVIRKNLAEQFNERPIGGGTVADTVIAKVFVSPDGKTWTVLMVAADGSACVAAYGKDWVPGTLPEELRGSL